MNRCLLSLVIMATLSSSAVHAQPDKLQESIGFDQKLDAAMPLDVTLRNENGETVKLGDYFRGRPVILMPVYYKCPMLCGLELQGLLRCMRGVSLTVGSDFEIVTYSIDHREDSELARQKKKRYIRDYNRPPAEEGWRFLTGDEESIRRLNEAIGFRAQYNEENGQYAHAAGIVVCTPDGRSSRYLYGVEFTPRDLRLALVEASKNEIGTFVDEVMLYCYMYDPTKGKYGLAIMNIVRGAGVLTVLAMAGGIGLMLRRDWKNRAIGLPNNAGLLSKV